MPLSARHAAAAAGRSRTSERMRLPRTTMAAIRLVHSADRAGLWRALALQLVAALAGIVVVVAGKLTLDVLLKIDDQDIGLSDLAAPLVLFAAASALSSSAGTLQSQQQRLLGERATCHVWARLLAVTSSTDLETYESPTFFDRLDRLQNNALSRPFLLVTSSLTIVGSLLGAISLALALLALQPVLIPPLAIGVVPSLALARRASRSEFAFVERAMEPFRHRAYLRRLLISRPSAAEVRAFGTAPVLMNQHDAFSDQYVDGLRRQVRLRQRLALESVVVSTAVLTATLVLLVLLLDHGWLSLASAGAAVIAVRMLSGQLTTVFTSTGTMMESAVFLNDLDDFLSTTPVRPDPVVPRWELREGLRADAVSFRYPGTERDVLTEVDLVIRPGEVVALVGENGSGKTTLAKIAAGLYAPGSGVLTWDGRIVDASSRAGLRRSTAVIFQDYVRYQMTLAENIGLGDPQRFDDGPAIEAAAARAGLSEVLTQLPSGFATMLSREFAGGIELSGGQWQRVALARAVFRDAPLVVLDEPTSALDPRAEHDLFADVRRLLGGRAALFISHRYANLHLADRIYVLADGRVVETGSHAELLDREGLYAELYRLQAHAFGQG